MPDDLIPYVLPDLSADVGASFLESRDLEELESGIRAAHGAGDLLALMQGVAIVKIEREGLWQQAGFSTLGAYQRDQAGRLGMPGTTISARRRIGESWLDYRKDLESLPLEGHVAKLRFFSAAVKRHGKKEALKAFTEKGYREFVSFVRPPRPHLEDVHASIRKGGLFIDGSQVASLSDDLAEEERDYLVGVIRRAYAARKGSCIAHVVSVYDEGEARAVDAFLKKFRSSK